MVKICYMVPSVKLGGAQSNLFLYLKHLDRSKFAITLICDKKGGTSSKLFRFPDVQVVRMSISGPYNIRGLFSIYRFLRKEKFNIVHTNNIKVDVLGLLAALVARVPVRISTIHEDTGTGFRVKRRARWNAALYLLLLRLVYATTTQLITVSKANREGVRGLTGRKPVEVIYNGYEPVPEIDRNVEGPRHFDALPVIAYNGRISPEKGFHILVEAVYLLKQVFGKVAVIVLGYALDLQYLKKVQGMIQDYGLGEMFHFAGFVEKVHPWLLNAQLVVLPSLSESMGLSTLDAWNCKLPVVAANVGGIPEVVTDGINGLLFKAGDTFQLAAKILYLIENPHIRNQLGQRGYQTLIDRFSITQHISQMEELYFVLAQAHGRK